MLPKEYKGIFLNTHTHKSSRNLTEIKLERHAIGQLTNKGLSVDK